MFNTRMKSFILSFLCWYYLTGVVKTNNQGGEKTPENGSPISTAERLNNISTVEIGGQANLNAKLENSHFEEKKAVMAPGRVARIPHSPVLSRTEIQPASEITVSNNMSLKEFIDYKPSLKSGRVALTSFSGANDAEDCETAAGQVGSCIAINKCKVVMETYRQQVPRICRWVKSIPIVCCPKPSIFGSSELVCGTRVINGINQFSSPSSTSGFSRMKRSVGGKNSTIGAWPWMVGIYKKEWGLESFLCGATIVNERYLVTAAQCFVKSSKSPIPTARYVVRVGSANIGEGKVHRINSIIFYPDYDPEQHYNDIAVLRLEDKLQFEPNVRPICLPTRQDFLGKNLQGRNVTVTGWGVQELGGRPSPVLQEVTVQVVDVEKCDIDYISMRDQALSRGITKEFICAGTREGGKDACQSDSGGPLMIQEKGIFFLIGVVSFGYKCGLADYPGVYTRITSYLDWVEEVTAQP